MQEAKGFDEFMAAPRKARDWARELAADASENEKTFGKRVIFDKLSLNVERGFIDFVRGTT